MGDFQPNLDEKEKADAEMKAKFCLIVLNNIKIKIISTFEEILSMDNIRHNPINTENRYGNEFMLRTVAGVLGVYGTEIEKFEEVVENFRIDERISAQYRHDISSYFSPVFTTFKLLIEEIGNITPDGDAQDREDKEEKIRQYITEIIHFWYRCQVSLEDLLLRNLSEEKISEEYCRGVEIKVIRGVLDFFSKEEIGNLIRYSNKDGSQYKGIKQRNIEISDIEWEELAKKLGERKISGNEGLVVNFIINALRNSLKERIDSGNVRLKMDIKDNGFIIRVEDDGKGMERKHLDPGFLEEGLVDGKRNSHFIFDKGSSDTGSSGLGLANFNTRLASTGGAVYIVSKRRDRGTDEKPIRYQYGGDDIQKEEIEFNQAESGTVFEIHLKLEEKK